MIICKTAVEIFSRTGKDPKEKELKEHVHNCSLCNNNQSHKNKACEIVIDRVEEIKNALSNFEAKRLVMENWKHVNSCDKCAYSIALYAAFSDEIKDISTTDVINIIRSKDHRN